VTSSPLIAPGATIGVLGSGQLGRMLAIAAREMGYRVRTFSPDSDSPTGQVADAEVVASYDDLDAVRTFARQVDVVTFEFENVPAATAEAAAEHALVRPGGHILHVTQQRAREKGFLAERGFPVTPFAHVRTAADLVAALDQHGHDAILKTASFGYDGKGQYRVRSREQAEAAWADMGQQEAILERFIPFEREVSMIGARGAAGWSVPFGLIENVHQNHILDTSVYPARVDPAVERRAGEIVRELCETFALVGVLCVEFFLTSSGELLINELAPRPHNSGHLTIDACVTSQFEQHVRAICGLPAGSTELLRPAAMANLLGDIWEGGEPDWASACAIPGVRLHLYGKASPRKARKMGHLTAVAHSQAQALEHAIQARSSLRAHK
jgi:5-(carboxyamino)imidazole ribonucleotide synthase